MSTRSYSDAVNNLNSLQSNAATLEALRASGGRMSEFAIPEMLEYLERIGYTPEDLNRMNVIHITGTKGKGSTSAFTDSILRHTKPDWKVGLYTSPHLVAVRERIRVNGVPISEEQFAQFFYEVWDRLDKNTTRKYPSTSLKPAYFRFVTLVAFHAFLSLKVDATILEVGVGGAYDSTNIVPKPVVTGVTSLGLDHVAVLGRTLSEIAWQKGGIYKKGVPALTVQQPEEGMTMLRGRAEELKASSFEVVSPSPELEKIKLGLAGRHQIQNAALAIALSRKFLEARASMTFEDPLPESFAKGLERARWPGRCQSVTDPKNENTTWFLDGAHTVESLSACIEWLVSPEVALQPTDVPRKRALIFNCTGGRTGSSLLGTLLTRIGDQLKASGSDEESTRFFDHVIFCTNVTYADGGFKSDLTTHAIPENDLAHLKTQKELASAWAELVPDFPSSNIHVLPSVEDAVKVVRELESPESKTQVLVTGSLHLVGGVIEVAGLSEVAL
ncbi:FolC bifunctional protein [Gloeophyllum trabeum ATCC 11539]|uniref:Folylpolyglutamate synthase n=1 Tax=Gloeophyllum trabeum (strain ATCC 11539 / FP-39264 / Madison 617) TaxID=670483 RepID=S7QKK6_GLOTA|nr:FolC bifunctional protein [Gloeophyllum trabeum ATCC 11539]EPQ59922.1 FolC bifunctional protein [Gloeophyllum trabeum ATCC 11539]